MGEYHLTLKNEKARWYTTIGMITIITNTLIFLYYSFSSSDSKIIISCGVCATIITGCFVLNAYLEKTGAGWKVEHYVLFLILTVQWIVLGHYEIAIMPILFSFLSRIAGRKLEVTIHRDRIAYPSFPLRNIMWADISNVILKDGILTIDLKNNKLIQQSIDEQQSRINEKEFNDFCNQQLRPSNG
jgi:hypothetical protein